MWEDYIEYSKYFKVITLINVMRTWRSFLKKKINAIIQN